MLHLVSCSKTIFRRDTVTGCLFLIGAALIVMSLSQDSLAQLSKSGANLPAAGDVAPSQSDSPQSSLGLGQGDDGSAERGSVFDRLVREIDYMIPGDLDKNPQRKKLVEEAITAFEARNAERTVEIFDQMTAGNAYLPPTDLLLASLSFIIRDPATGKILLERVSAEHPEHLGVSAAFSRLAINEGRITDGIVHLEKLQRLLQTPGVPSDVRDFYAMHYLDGSVDVAMRRKRYTKARSLLEQRRAQFPESQKAQLVSAELEFWEKNIDKSLGYLQALKKANPKARVPESIIANWYRRTGDQAGAQKWLLDAAAKYPADAQVQLEYASWAIGKEDFGLATRAIASAEKNGTENEFSRILKGKIAFAKGSFSAASLYFETVAAANPKNIDAMNLLALSMIESMDEKKRKDALRVAEYNFRAAPNNLVSRSALGYIHLRLGNLEKAKAALAVGASSKRGASPEIDFFVASVLNAMDQKKNARQVLDVALAHKGFFLYRLPAKKLLNDLGGPLPSSETEK